MGNMRFTKLQFEVLHILWSADTPLSMQEIADRSKYRFAGKLILSITIEELLTKSAVYRAGFIENYLNKKETVILQYAAKIRFEEYYAEEFKKVAPGNLFHLIKRILQLDKLSPKQIRELYALLADKSKAYEP